MNVTFCKRGFADIIKSRMLTPALARRTWGEHHGSHMRDTRGAESDDGAEGGERMRCGTRMKE